MLVLSTTHVVQDCCAIRVVIAAATVDLCRYTYTRHNTMDPEQLCRYETLSFVAGYAVKVAHDESVGSSRMKRAACLIMEREKQISKGDVEGEQVGRVDFDYCTENVVHRVWPRRLIHERSNVG